MTFCHIVSIQILEVFLCRPYECVHGSMSCMWKQDKFGYYRVPRGHCGRPHYLPWLAWDWSTKLKDRITEKIWMEMKWCLLQKELGQQTQSLSDLSKIIPFVASYLLTVSQYLPFLEQYNMQQVHSTVLQPSSQEQDHHLFHLSQGLFKKNLWLSFTNGVEFMQ